MGHDGETVRLYSIPKTAEILSVNAKSVYRLITALKIRTVDVSASGKARMRVRADDLQAFIDARS